MFAVKVSELLKSLGKLSQTQLVLILIYSSRDTLLYRSGFHLVDSNIRCGNDRTVAIVRFCPANNLPLLELCSICFDFFQALQEGP